jgi:hypothetical protein
MQVSARKGLHQAGIAAIGVFFPDILPPGIECRRTQRGIGAELAGQGHESLRLVRVTRGAVTLFDGRGAVEELEGLGLSHGRCSQPGVAPVLGQGKGALFVGGDYLVRICVAQPVMDFIYFRAIWIATVCVRNGYSPPDAAGRVS